MLVVAAAVLVGVIAVAVGRGGELTYFQADYAPLRLDEVSATDVVLFRPPLTLWGYNAQATDEALNRIADALTERDIELSALRHQVETLRESPGPSAGRESPGPSAGPESTGRDLESTGRGLESTGRGRFRGEDEPGDEPDLSAGGREGQPSGTGWAEPAGSPRPPGVLPPGPRPPGWRPSGLGDARSAMDRDPALDSGSDPASDWGSDSDEAAAPGGARPPDALSPGSWAESPSEAPLPRRLPSGGRAPRPFGDPAADAPTSPSPYALPRRPGDSEMGADVFTPRSRLKRTDAASADLPAADHGDQDPLTDPEFSGGDEEDGW
jgi:hypothetical protein